jgi:hypothetical protein
MSQNIAVLVYTVAMAEYSIEVKPDYATLGPRLDRFFETHFPPNRKLGVRAIFLADHPNMTRDELVASILKLGTDRYDSNRKGIHHNYYAPHGVERHLVVCRVTDKLRGLDDADYVAAESVFAEFMEDFYESALTEPERGYSMRMDILIVYDLDALVAVPKDRPRGYAFKHPDRKPEALLAIINVLAAEEVSR